MIPELRGNEVLVVPAEQNWTLRISRVLSVFIFSALVFLLIVAAVPYGTAEIWWKGFFSAAVFALTILWIVEANLSGSWRTGGYDLLLPMICLAVFSFVQTIPFKSQSQVAGISGGFWNSISADPFATRFFVIQLLALILSAALLFRFATSDRRLKVLANTIITIAVGSALFGIVRQTTQHSTGFGLPLIKPDQGYGQFINRNHFAFLMEMGFGLALGIVLGGVKRERGLIYLGAILPIWTALVLSNSRGGLIAMLAQVASAALGYTIFIRGHSRSLDHDHRWSRVFRSLPARVILVAVLLLGVVVGTLWLGGDRLATKIEEGHEFNPALSELRQNARRNQIWRATWHMFAAHPIAGVGMGGYWAAIPRYHDASGVLTPQEAHNDYLELLASGGLVGFACGIWFLVMLVRRVRGNLRTSSGFRRGACFGASLALVGVAVHSLVDFGLHMLANALICTALIVIATAVSPRPRVRLINE